MEPGELIRPPEAPVFQPTMEEFKDPIAYLSKIRPVVVNTGICKIKPPLGWKPPFAINVDMFRFTPRLQPLNELEAKTRVKLNFLDTLTKFWEMQGVSFKIPNVNRTPLDLHKLYKIVTSNGGFEQVCHSRKWVFVAREMQYDNISVSGSLRINYEKYLLPFEIFQVNNDLLKLPVVVSKSPVKLMSPVHDMKPEKCEKNDENDFEYIEEMGYHAQPETLRERMPRRSKRRRLEDPDYDFEFAEDNPEFRKLMFTAPGPKNAYGPMEWASRQLSTCYRMSGDGHDSSSCDSSQKGTTKEVNACMECGGDYCPEDILLCSGCKATYHMFCLIPRLPCVPSGKWFCSFCIAKECCQPPEAFGFEQGKLVHSLQSFGQMANQFKTDYFNQQPTDVPYATVEKEFWRLVTSMDDDVTVEYGADLHSSRHGSGFPTYDPSNCCVTVTGAEEFADSGWNLNNLPTLKGSVLSYIDVDISGMKVPWLYVGMCFSCFCWHTEDHWSYSINYLHWGEAKTWYGVPSAYADALEATMKEQAPELFENQPDLMHHLATTLNPSLLMKNGIPVVRTDQCAGEFVVTFPRAYHAGFNQGFNFAEAVNFALADWLPVGRQSIEHYQMTQKSPVFSHDELICKMIAKPGDLELSVLIMAAKDSTKMLSIEEQLRYNGLCRDDGKEIFELLTDDDRQCCICKTCCFLSGVRCACSASELRNDICKFKNSIEVLSCLYHYKEMCACPLTSKRLRYRYSLEELHQLVSTAQKRANLFCEWANEVDQLLDGCNQPKPDLQFMEALLHDGETKGFNNCEQYHELVCAVSEAKRILTSIRNILQLKNRDHFISISDLKQILEDGVSLPCCILECESLEAHLHSISMFQKEVQSTLSALQSSPSVSSEDINVLEQLLNRGENYAVDLPQLEELKQAIMQLTWVQDTQSVLNNGSNLHIDTLKNMYKKGQTVHSSKAVESVLITLKALITVVQDWEHRVKSSFKDKPSHPISFYESLLEEASQFSVTIPLVATLTHTVQQAKEWNASASKIQASDKHPHYDILKELLSSAHPLSIRLEQLPQIESRYSAAKAWVDRTARTFLKKNSVCSLLEVLLPRTASTLSQYNNCKANKKKYEGEYVVQRSLLSVANGDRLKEMELIHDMEKEEKIFINKIRKSNLDKQQQDEQSSTSSVLYCLCRKPESGYMLQCEVCNEWYHANCLHIPKSKLNQESDVSKDMRFICGSCLRSRRPRFDAIVSLLISLQKVPVAISEGTALHCLAERAMSWQKKARELVTITRAATEEARSQQLRLADIRKRIDKWKLEISTEAAEMHKQLTNQADSVLRHYESQLQKEKAAYAGLSDGHRRNVEDTLLDGDLLEVTTDETTQLWQLLQTDSECLSYFNLSEEDASKAILPKFSSQIKKSSLILEETEETCSPSMPLKKKRKGEFTEVKEITSDVTPKRKRGGGKQSEKKRNSSLKSMRSYQSPVKDIDHSEALSDDNKQEQCGLSEDTDCSAPQCIRPMASQISWVQCDLCQQWFHLLCVGLTAESVEKIDIYNCCVCKQKSISERKALINNYNIDKKPTSVYASILSTQITNKCS